MSAISAVHSQAVYHRPSITPPAQQEVLQGPQKAKPAQSARAALSDRSDLAAKPFGSLVSLFAKGLPLPLFENSEDSVSATPEQTSDTPLSDPKFAEA